MLDDGSNQVTVFHMTKFDGTHPVVVDDRVADDRITNCDLVVRGLFHQARVSVLRAVDLAACAIIGQILGLPFANRSTREDVAGKREYDEIHAKTAALSEKFDRSGEAGVGKRFTKPHLGGTQVAHPLPAQPQVGAVEHPPLQESSQLGLLQPG